MKSKPDLSKNLQKGHALRHRLHGGVNEYFQRRFFSDGRIWTVSASSKSLKTMSPAELRTYYCLFSEDPPTSGFARWQLPAQDDACLCTLVFKNECFL